MSETENHDEDVLKEYANKAFERPSNAFFWDERCYTTHVPVMGWAERGDDILEESNYHSALKRIEEAAEDESHWWDGTASDWLVGSLRQIWIQVYEGGCPEGCEGPEEFTHEEFCAHDPENRYCRMWCKHECDGSCSGTERTFTAAFREAVSIAESLHTDPILDESDYSERESEAFEKALTDAIESAQRDYWEDSDQESEGIAERYREDDYATHRNQWCHPDDVDYKVVAEEYAESRDAYFTERAQEIADELSMLGLLVTDNRPCPGAGQLAFDEEGL